LQQDVKSNDAQDDEQRIAALRRRKQKKKQNEKLAMFENQLYKLNGRGKRYKGVILS